jgi:hypothetical protein
MEQARCGLPQLGVYQREQPIQRVAVSRPQGNEPPGDLARAPSIGVIAHPSNLA